MNTLYFIIKNNIFNNIIILNMLFKKILFNNI